jgi:group I intron endonuclease
LKNYYTISFISRKSRGNSYIYNAILSQGYSAFSLTIIEYIDISNLSKDEARQLILEREQHYIDSLSPEYNILRTAGSLLGYKHTEETIAKISSENSYMYGKTHSAETLTKMSAAKSGENNPMAGKPCSDKVKGIIKEIHSMPLYVYDAKTKSLLFRYDSRKDFVKAFKVSTKTVIKYVNSGDVFRKLYILSNS